MSVQGISFLALKWGRISLKKCRKVHLDAYFHQASLKCGCYPAGLQLDQFANFPLCNPQGITCYRSQRFLRFNIACFFSLKISTYSFLRNYSLPSRSCKIPCHGLYSDVEHEAISQTIGLETPGMSQLMKEYLSFKRGNLTDPVPYLSGTFPIRH